MHAKGEEIKKETISSTSLKELIYSIWQQLLFSSRDPSDSECQEHMSIGLSTPNQTTIYQLNILKHKCIDEHAFSFSK